VDPEPVAPEWLRNGSFLVFRRLRQEVQAFRDFMEQAAAGLKQRPGFDWVTRPLLEAMFVGRWPSGVPVLRAPLADPGDFDAFRDNHFLFESPVPEVRLRPEADGPVTTPALEIADIGGRICPHAAHIRKVNPRDQDTDLGDSSDSLTRRILRRGIPFGEPLADPAPAGDTGERGLLFLCYQRSIRDQFEVQTQNWANSREAPKSGGHDPIIGQSLVSEMREREFGVTPRPAGAVHDLSITKEWVIPSGGGYFFAPSISAIRDKLIGKRIET